MVEHIGDFMVRGYNLETKRNAKVYERPSLLDWRLSQSQRYKDECADMLGIDLSGFVTVNFNENWKNQKTFVDINFAEDLEEVILKAL